MARLSIKLAQRLSGLLLLSLGFCTLVLFFFTGKTTPTSFVPIADLDFGFLSEDDLTSNNGKPLFLCFSPSGRCFYTPTSGKSRVPAPEAEAEDIDYYAWDTSTMTRLSTFRRNRNTGGWFDISPNKQWLAGFTKGRLDLLRLSTGKHEVVDITSTAPDGELTLGEVNIVYSPDSRQIIVYSSQIAIQFDLIERRVSSAFHPERNRLLNDCFFDDLGRPKALEVSGDEEQFEIWDFSSNHLDFAIDLSDPQNKRIPSNLYNPSFVFSAFSPNVAFESDDRKTVTVRSVADESLHKIWLIPIENADLLKISPDGRFLIFAYSQENPLCREAGKWNKRLKEWLSEVFPETESLALVEASTGKIWRSLPGKRYVTFSEDGTRLISFTDESRCEYELPPRWQYFTPWAWAALGSWLSLFLIWWKLRKPVTAEIMCSPHLGVSKQ